MSLLEIYCNPICPKYILNDQHILATLDRYLNKTQNYLKLQVDFEALFEAQNEFAPPIRKVPSDTYLHCWIKYVDKKAH